MSIVLEEKNEAGTTADTALSEERDIAPEDLEAKIEADATAEIAPEISDVNEDTPTIPDAIERSASEIIMEDLEELIAEFPELSDLRDASELSDPIRYGKLRDLGLSPKEAYLATSGRKRAIDTRAHLSGARPKPLNTPSSISAYAVRCVRELFDGISDEEIISLYRRVNG